MLARIAYLVKKFVQRVYLAQGLPEPVVNAAGGEICTFGSYRLGVHGPGTDIDTLCVVPKHVSRDDFFDVFEPMLREMEGVTEVLVGRPTSSITCSYEMVFCAQGVPTAYVPIIKAKILNIPIDFLMA
jgi:poly(A) polymerase